MPKKAWIASAGGRGAKNMRGGSGRNDEGEGGGRFQPELHLH